MTNCTEALRLLTAAKREIDADAHLKCLLCHEEKGHFEECPAPEIDAFLADPSTCDAEKAVLVEAATKALEWISAVEVAKMPGVGDTHTEVHRELEAALANTSPAAAALLAQGERHKAALEAQVTAHEYRFGPEGREAETAEELNTFMAKAQDLDEVAWQLTRAVLAPGEEKDG